MDQVVIQCILVPLRATLLQQLQDMVEAHRPDQWFEVYLIVFVLLSSIEAAATHSKMFALRFGLPVSVLDDPYLQMVTLANTQALQRRYSNMAQMEGFFHGCKILLAHFHFVCNGSIPLQLDWTKPKTIAFAKLDKEQIDFMQKTQSMIKEKGRTIWSLFNE